MSINSSAGSSKRPAKAATRSRRSSKELTSRGAGGVAQVSETAREYVQQAGSYVQSAGERMREGYGQFAEGARERFGMVEDIVRHNPAESVAAAFGFDLAIGIALGQALRSR
jgi:ElaB/YqjD/DUF883 family membrane-anchored ribosome-binding protein